MDCGPAAEGFPILVRIAAALGLAAAVYVAAFIVLALMPRAGPADLAVVFGNEVLADGVASPRLAARLDTALSARARGLVALIMVSGGKGASGFNEADVMQAYLIRAGVPADAVLVDQEGVNTMATAVHAAAILRARGLRSAMVVTQWFHVPRCILAMRRNDVGVVAATYPAFVERRDVYSVARELADLPRYALLPIARLDPQTR